MNKNELLEHCAQAAKMVASWPKWKQEVVSEALINSPWRKGSSNRMPKADKDTYESIRLLQNDIHQDNVEAGWWLDPETQEDLRDPKHLKKTLGWKFLLAHSEISEAIEGVRRNLKDDKLPHRAMVEVEIADTIIRLLDIAGAMGLDVAGAIEEKRAFNAKRSDHKMENRQAKGGKAF